MRYSWHEPLREHCFQIRGDPLATVGTNVPRKHLYQFLDCLNTAKSTPFSNHCGSRFDAIQQAIETCHILKLLSIRNFDI